MNQPNMTQTSRPAQYGKIDFIKLAPLMGWISLITFIVAVGLIATRGFHYGIDFAGGTEVQLKFAKSVSPDEVRGLVDQLGFKNSTVQSLDTANDEYMVRFESSRNPNEKLANEENNQAVKTFTAAVKEKMPLAENGILRVDSVGPQVGSELKKDSILATFYSLLIILIYVGLRFDVRYAPGAVICLFHDAIVTLGFYSLFGWEVNIQVLAAVLTVIGYSINDTIINFDRIRENMHIHRGADVKFIINKSTNDVLSRTILTAGTTLMSAIALLVLGTGAIRDLALALVIGIVLGTYSSVYVAAPFVLLIDKFQKKNAVKA